MKQINLYEQLIKLLDQHGIKYRLIDHIPEGRTEIVSPLRGNKLSEAAKCMVVAVNVSKKEIKYILGVIPGDKKIDFNLIKNLSQGSYASFAPAEIAEKLSGSVVGTVLPFTFNPELELVVDPLLLENSEIYFNAARLDRSMALNTKDYLKVANPRIAPISQENTLPAQKVTAASPLNDLRHSTAHLLAAAITELYPEAKLTLGPSIEDGFYYDIDDLKIAETDFPKIEKLMHKLANTWMGFERHEVSVEEARAEFAGNPYKLELIEEHKGDGAITVYQSGKFRDLCRGGHVETPNKVLKFFKLTKLAGAYWHGDEKNKMLTRIYGTAFFSQEELDKYLWVQEEAKKRDHRKLGRELELFMSSPSVGSGFPLFMPKGWLIRHELENWIIAEKQKRDYKFVWTPHVAKSSIYKQSGHWQKYDAMMSPMQIDDEEYVVKPMNCPHHFQIYNETPHSYRELPLRLAEIATVYRYEKAGEVNGLLRVRALTQDDTHTFVRHDQISAEIDRVIELTKHVYSTFGFTDYQARISVRDPNNPDKYMGKPTIWDQAEKALMDAAKRHNIPSFVGEGEAAFYGPKIDVVIKDALGRDWQLTTIQLDFVQPENFDMTYVDEKGEKVRPAVLHIAILGSLDRFMGILIEHYAGAFPMWLAPVQVAMLPISENELGYVKDVATALMKEGFRVEVDESANTLGKKMVRAREQKVPYLAIIGKQEVENKTITLKNRAGEQITLNLDETIAKLKQEVASKL